MSTENDNAEVGPLPRIYGALYDIAAPLSLHLTYARAGSTTAFWGTRGTTPHHGPVWRCATPLPRPLRPKPSRLFPGRDTRTVVDFYTCAIPMERLACTLSEDTLPILIVLLSQHPSCCKSVVLSQSGWRSQPVGLAATVALPSLKSDHTVFFVYFFQDIVQARLPKWFCKIGYPRLCDKHSIGAATAFICSQRSTFSKCPVPLEPY